LDGVEALAGVQRGGDFVKKGSSRGSRPNMKELAEALNLDRSTVSRALSEDKSHLVGLETRLRVREAAMKLGYRTDLTAAALRKGRTDTVGIIVSDLENEIFITVLRQIMAELHGTGLPNITPLIGETRDDLSATQDLLHRFLSRRVDAIISLAASEDQVDILRSAAEQVPVVLAIRSIRGIDLPSALCDDQAGGAMVAAHFAARGHKYVCQVQGPVAAATFRNRARGFSHVCKQSGLIEVPSSLIVRNATNQEGRDSFASILKASPRPTAIFAHNDSIAIGLVEDLRSGGFRCPEDFAIVGFNNTQISRVLAVPLSTVDYPTVEVGRHAARLVSNLIENRDYAWKTSVFSPSLLVRASS
jgi:LacI family transcriptional regulator